MGAPERITRALHTQVAVPKRAVRIEFDGAALPGDPTALDDGVMVGERDQALDRFVDDQKRLTGALGLRFGCRPIQDRKP